MKNLLFGLMVAATAAVLTGCVTKEPGADIDLATAKDPVAPYQDYDPAIAPVAGCPMAVEWQNSHDKELAAAVKDEVLATFVKDSAAADKLLAKVTKAYEADAMASTQIAAVSQYVMGKDRFEQRKVWVNALMTRVEKTDDTYVKLFCLDQLRWCGCQCPKLLERVAAVEKGAKCKAVREMAGILLRELNNKGIGR